MPRGFLVKRYSKAALPQRVRRYSDEDRSDSSSDHDPSDGALYASGAARLGPTAGELAISPEPTLSSPSPPLPYGKVQDEPLALTTSATNIATSNSSTSQIFAPLRHSVLYFPRLETVPTTPPRPKEESPLSTTPPFPPKKRPAAASPDQERNNNNHSTKPPKPVKRSKVVRKLNFDEDKSSPVSGTFIRDADSDDDLPPPVRRGDIDPSLNVVVVTEEARAELAKIENRIGDYVCQLCKEHYQDAFGLAQHRCSRIVHVEYRCPECDKVFNCPANLASHRRWHKPRATSAAKTAASTPPRLLPSNAGDQAKSETVKMEQPGLPEPSDSDSLRETPSPENPASFNGEASSTGDEEYPFECEACGKKFRRQAYLRKHLLTHASSNRELLEGEDEENGISPDRDDFSCSQCGQAFRTIAEYANHAILHSGPTVASECTCVVCGASFPSRPALEKHALTHNGDIYSCKYCSSTFYSSPGLTRHINKHHPSENRQVILLQMPSVRPVST